MFDQLYNVLIRLVREATQQPAGTAKAFLLRETPASVTRLQGVRSCTLAPVSFPGYIRYRLHTQQGAVFIEYRYEAGQLMGTLVTPRRIYTT